MDLGQSMLMLTRVLTFYLSLETITLYYEVVTGNVIERSGIIPRPRQHEPLPAPVRFGLGIIGLVGGVMWWRKIGSL